MSSTPRLKAQSFELDMGFRLVSELRDTNGVSVADYDQDGDMDIFLVSIHKFQEGNSQTWSRLLRNNRQNGFEDVTVESKLLFQNETLRDGWMGDRMGASWGDYDNDGYPDLFLSNDGGDELWHNEGNGQFKNVTQSSGVEGCLDCYSSNGLWWDYDLDGDLDLYVSDWLKTNRLHRNDGNGIFIDVSEFSGLDDEGKTWTSIPIDVNRDTYPDLYVVNDFGESRLFINQGNDRFSDSTRYYQLENLGDGMGIDVCDYDSDGNFDIYVTNIYDHLPNPFFVGSEEGIFTNRASELGIENTGWGWGARFFDADNDLDEDLYVVNGMKVINGRGDRNVFFENEDGIFNNISQSLGVNSISIGRGLEVFDCDNDGDMDMLVGNRETNLTLYKNNTMQTDELNKNWIQIELEGTESNRNAFGSIVEINLQGKHYYRHYSGANLFGQSIKPIHFGLAHHEFIDEISVTWPSGKKEYFPTLSANQGVKLTEGDTEVYSSNVVLGINESDALINIYPNPFDKQIILRFPENTFGQVNFRLISTSGQVVYHEFLQKPYSAMLDFSNTKLRSGLYYYQLEIGEYTSTGKLLKK
ncbi:MAG: hypothetical protein CBB92_14400 [Flammeovirgaceae bacterium TMED32]|nr:MAG: hypothetical protein CBB92_14400 [Flammeovirgaceae bacterium TMED32]